MQIFPGPITKQFTNTKTQSIVPLLCLWFTITTSVWYLYHFGSYFTNNLLWPHYNSTGYQTFLVDCINGISELPNNIPLSTFAMIRDYSSPFIAPVLHPAYAMSLTTTKLTSLQYAIASLRNSTVSALMTLPTQYCWVDFSQTWQLAHTTRRQNRCQKWYGNNGAVYLESMLRNTNLSDLFNQSYPEYVWNYALFDGLRQTTMGEHWLQTIYTTNATVSDEVAYWQSQNITKYQLQWQDSSYPGLDESITIVNAIGISLPVVLKSTPPRSGKFHSYYFNAYFTNDLWAVGFCSNYSVLQGTANYYINKEWLFGINATSYEVFLFLGDWSGNYFNQEGVIRQALGPFGSSDLWVVPVPEVLANLFVAQLSILYNAIAERPKMAAKFSSIQSFISTPTPPRWKYNYLFYGGNPLCVDGEGQNFTQTSIAFDADCLHQLPLTVALTPASMVLSMLFTDQSIAVENICSQQQSVSCNDNLHKAQSLLTILPVTLVSVSEVSMAIKTLNVSIMQYATDLIASNWTILIQPLIEERSPWTFYGWAMLVDWVLGIREVISLEGDNGSLVLMSEAYSQFSMALQQGTMTQASLIVYCILLYISVVTLLLGVICTIVSFPSRFENLFFFHRLVGSTWIGRPLMFLRGAVAIVLISTATIHLQSNSSITRLELPSRSLIETIVLSYEATWIAAVIHEFLLPFLVGANGRAIAVISVGLSWLVCILIDILSPVTMSTEFKYQCKAVNMISQLYCTSGIIQTGSFNRVLLLLIVQCIIVLIIGTTGKLCSRDKANVLDNMTVMGACRVFLLPPMDRVAGILTGALPWSNSQSFDVKLWSFISLKDPQIFTKEPNNKGAPKRCKTLALVGIGIIWVSFSISSSISYLQMIQVNLPNDLVWKSFNITGTHVFLADWFLETFLVYNDSKSYNLDGKAINYAKVYNLTDPVIHFNGHVGAHKQYTELISLTSAISALRRYDGCEVPWLFTQYCYLDFDKKWEMANSARRQQRCTKMVSNAAIFLEAVLRNVDWESWRICWGDAFDIGFANELRRSTSGVNFLQSLPSKLSVFEEEVYWQQYKFTSFTPQWQNYKYIGIVSTYTITNAYGVSNLFKIASTHGTYRWKDESSLKMYWAFGNDLKYVLDNTTLIGGKSLLRSSSQYAFSNISLQDIYLRSTTYIPSPWHPIYALLEKNLGPFGSIDMIFVKVPDVVREFAKVVLKFSQAIRQSDPVLYQNVTTSFLLRATPKTWSDIGFISVGGSVLCPIQNSEYPHSTVFGHSSFSYDLTCDPNVSYLNPYLYPSQNHLVFALILVNLNVSTSTCQQVLYSRECEVAMNSTLKLLSNHSTAALYNLWANTLYDTIYKLNIEYVQFGQNSTPSPVILYHVPLLNPLDPQFDFFAWLMLYDWIIGKSEVVYFQGDNGNFTLLGNTMTDYTQQVDPSQLPTVFSLLAQRSVQYVTFVMIALACITFLYIVFSRGYVEGLNMLELSRVGGIVWIGRPLVFLRSLTALCLLSTATVELNTQNGISYIKLVQEPWYQTCLAANEVTWLVGIVNDIFIVYTKEWALKYGTINSKLVLIISAVLAMLLPVVPTITFKPQCQIETLDYQITCNLGNVAIGSSTRLLLLCGIVVFCNLCCFACARLFFKAPTTRASSSVLLCGGARYMFIQEGWTDNGVYYMDMASAAMNGILSCRYASKWYLFDIKTWQIYILKASSGESLSDKKFHWAIPLKD